MRSIIYRSLLPTSLLALTLIALPAWGQSGRQRTTAEPIAAQDEKKPQDAPANKGLSEEQLQDLRRQRSSEEAAADVSYLRNYFEEYRLGPEDVISVEVFGQQTQIYSQPSIIVPPDGKINYKLIGSINVRGRTVEDVQKEIAEKLNEYIIDPKVTVQLLQSHSMKYIVDGDVGRPGIFEMTRRLTVREAVVFSGGILPTGDESKVQIARAMPNGQRIPGSRRYGFRAGQSVQNHQQIFTDYPNRDLAADDDWRRAALLMGATLHRDTRANRNAPSCLPFLHLPSARQPGNQDSHAFKTFHFLLRSARRLPYSSAGTKQR
jgi:polysaccharide export outer membrane protein